MLIAASKNVSFVSSCEATYCAVKREPKNIEVTMIEAMHTTVDMPVCAFSVSDDLFDAFRLSVMFWQR